MSRLVTIHRHPMPDFTQPHPVTVALPSGDVQDQDFWRGDPFRLVGFQDDLAVQRVNLHLDGFADNPQNAVGKYPVYVDKDGGMGVYETAVAKVIEREAR